MPLFSFEDYTVCNNSLIMDLSCIVSKPKLCTCVSCNICLLQATKPLFPWRPYEIPDNATFEGEYTLGYTMLVQEWSDRIVQPTPTRKHNAVHHYYTCIQTLRCICLYRRDVDWFIHCGYLCPCVRSNRQRKHQPIHIHDLLRRDQRL